MDVRVSLEMVKSYYEECYDETIKYRLKYRKWHPHLVVFYFALFILFLVIGDNQKSYTILMFGSLVTGLILLYDLIAHKRKWLAARLESQKEGKLFKLHFSDEEIISEGPFSKGVIKWNGFLEVQETAKGVFLVIEKGLNIYLPNSIWTTIEDKKAVLAKFASISNAKVEYFQK